MAQAPVVTIRARPWYLCSRPSPAALAVSPTASATKPGTASHSASSGSTWRSNGSSISPGRMRAARARGTCRGKVRAARRAAGRCARGRSSRANKVSASVMASRICCCQPVPVCARLARPAWIREWVAPLCISSPVYRLLQATAGFMATYSTNQFKGGLKIILDGDPFSIVENEFVKHGKGQAFNRVKMRNLKTGRVVEKTFKSGDTVEAADVLELDLQYLYSDGEFWHFMDADSFEQYQ